MTTAGEDRRLAGGFTEKECPFVSPVGWKLFHLTWLYSASHRMEIGMVREARET